MEYDRGARRILGYQQSTGRVFVQGSGESHTRKVSRTNGLIIMVPRTSLSRLRETSSRTKIHCRVLTSGIEWIDTDATQATSGQQWSTLRTEREIRIESNLNEDYSCICLIRSTGDALRGTPVFKIHGCKAHDRERNGLHPIQGWLAHAVSRHKKCKRLESVLQGHYIMSIDASILHDTSGQPCWQVALQTQTAPGVHFYEKLQSLSVPKAVLAVEAKHVVVAFGAAGDVIEGSMQAALHLAFVALTKVRASNLTNITGLYGELPLEFKSTIETCVAKTDMLLELFLHSSRVSFTPDHANLTLVIRSAARYVLDIGSCQLRSAEKVLHFWECVGDALHFRQHAPDAPLALLQRRLSTLNSQLMEKVDDEALCHELLALADAVLKVATMSSSLAVSNISSSTYVWIDILCCTIRSPYALVQTDSISCRPLHTRYE
jgi:hypothetical protein